MTVTRQLRGRDFRLDAENTEDLNILLPNVDIRGGGVSNGTSSFAVRGIPGIARYMDGVVLAGTIAGIESVVELERIEVLRGPQGTYFGKNAIGGAIQYITQKPGDEFGARVKATLGEYNRTDTAMLLSIDSVSPPGAQGHRA